MRKSFRFSMQSVIYWVAICAVLLLVASKMNWNPRGFWHDHWTDPRTNAAFSGGSIGLEEDKGEACFAYLCRSGSDQPYDRSRDRAEVSSSGVYIGGERFDWPQDSKNPVLLLVEDGKLIRQCPIRKTATRQYFTKNKPMPLTLADELWSDFKPLKAD